MSGFNLIALDSNFEIVSLLSYTNLQWSRKYNEPGIFSVEIPLNQYDTRFHYLYTKDRQEMGVIEQIYYTDEGSFRSINLSGFFLENELNHHIVFKKGTDNIKNSPVWVNYEGNAEDVAYKFFEGFKTITFDNDGVEVTSRMEIDSGTNQNRGKNANHERCGERLGDKIYHILKASEMSYSVKYDFVTSKKIFEVWSGKDRTQDQNINNPVTFSTNYGNIKKPKVLIDKTEYRNVCVVENQTDDSVFTQIVSNADVNEIKRFVYIRSALNKADYSTDQLFYSAMKAEGRAELSERIQIINVEFDAIEGSYEYMKDFDLGDKCNIEIPEVGISANAILIGCYEVMKKGTWSLTLEFGTPILRNRR